MTHQQIKRLLTGVGKAGRSIDTDVLFGGGCPEILLIGRNLADATRLNNRQHIVRLTEQGHWMLAEMERTAGIMTLAQFIARRTVCTDLEKRLGFDGDHRCYGHTLQGWVYPDDLYIERRYMTAHVTLHQDEAQQLLHGPALIFTDLEPLERRLYDFWLSECSGAADMFERATSMTLLDDAVLVIQETIGQTDGGFAGQFFVHEAADWKEISPARRIDMLQRYCRYEILHHCPAALPAIGAGVAL